MQNSYVRSVTRHAEKINHPAIDGDGGDGDGLRHGAFVPVSEIDEKPRGRIKTDLDCINAAMGGGLPMGASIAIAGSPGAGKTTLLQQFERAAAVAGHVAVHITAEENKALLIERLARLGPMTKEQKAKLVFAECSDVNDATYYIKKVKPKLVVVDSVQVYEMDDVDSAAGSPNQVTAVSRHFAGLARESGPQGMHVIIIGHIKKDGGIAGPMFFAHIVDTVWHLHSDGGDGDTRRVLTMSKNRFGTEKPVILDMVQDGGFVQGFARDGEMDAFKPQEEESKRPPPNHDRSRDDRPQGRIVRKKPRNGNAES